MKHGLEKFQLNDDSQMHAMNGIMEFMKKPNEMTILFNSKRKEFEELEGY